LAGTGIQRNPEESGPNTGIPVSCEKFLKTWLKTGIFISAPKVDSCENSSGKKKS